MKVIKQVLLVLGWLLVSFSRGIALFLGVFAALSFISFVLGDAYNSNIWWIDLNRLPQIIAWILQIALIPVLIAFCFRVPRKLHWRIVGTAVCGLFALIAVENVITVYSNAKQGLVTLGFPVPFSLFTLLAFVALALAMFFGYRSNIPKTNASFSIKQLLLKLACIAVIAITVFCCGIAFPIGQMMCFGSSDYRGQVDAVVVFGAQVHADGKLSRTLANRVDRAIELYEQGYTPVLIMSGGTGAAGTNEAEAMRDYAIERRVPASAIIIDNQGNNSALTVEHTASIAKERGFKRIGAVSSYYHLPRIKMQYFFEGYDVLTVPASSDGEGTATQISADREITAWWYYWFTGIFRLNP